MMWREKKLVHLFQCVNLCRKRYWSEESFTRNVISEAIIFFSRCISDINSTHQYKFVLNYKRLQLTFYLDRNPCGSKRPAEKSSFVFDSKPVTCNENQLLKLSFPANYTYKITLLSMQFVLINKFLIETHLGPMENRTPSPTSERINY